MFRVGDMVRVKPQGPVREDLWREIGTVQRISEGLVHVHLTGRHTLSFAPVWVELVADTPFRQRVDAYVKQELGL